MSKIEELINQHCPNGVEYKRLGDLGTFYGGITGKSKADFTDGNAKFISYMNVYSNPAVNQDCIDTVKIGADEKQRTLQYCDVCFTGSSETPDECGIASVVTDAPSEPLYLNSFCFFLRFDNPKLFNPHFLKHLFRDHELRHQICKTANGVTRFNVSKELMKDVEIPVPPLPVQEEIVSILDKMTELETELETELDLRKKQYEYYRDKMFELDACSMMKIGDITRVFSASRVHKEDWKTEGVPFYRSSDVMSFFNGVDNPRGKVFISFDLYEKLSAKSGKVHKDDILITGGGSIGIPYIVPDDSPIYMKDADLLCIQKNDMLLSKFLRHYFLSTKFRDYLANITHNATIAHYTIEQIKNTTVPVPDIETQKHIVDLLDRFEQLACSISEGLPAEIKMRHQQYEYYRDRLLTFKRLEVS